MKEAPRKQELCRALENYFGADARRVRHAKRTAEYAELILPGEAGADPGVVIAAALLHDIGIRNAEAKYGSADPAQQEAEGPPAARGILEALGCPEDFIREVCDIIGHHHHPRAEETANFKVLYAADRLVNLEEEQPGAAAAPPVSQTVELRKTGDAAPEKPEERR